MAKIVKYCIASVVLYFLFGYFFLPFEVCATGWYFLGALFSPLLFAFLLYLLNKIGFISFSKPLFTLPDNLEKFPEIPIEEKPKHQVSQPAHVIHTLHQPTPEEILDKVDHMDGLGFERWCAQLLQLIEFSDIKLTKASGDQGVDIIAIKNEIRYAIQCKCYSSDLGNHPVQEVHAGKSIYHCHVGVVMTNRHFTSGAQELAKATDTLLWDRDKLKAMLQKIPKENRVKL